jgi:Icc-related predicted phosphoesterase
MKIVTISDTHGKHHELTKDLTEADIIIHAGDCTNVGKDYELLNFLDWFGGLPYKHKIFIAGNHDFYFEDNNDIAQKYKDKGVIYLMDQMVEVEGLKIYGSPWQPRFYDWAFNVNRGEEIAKKWAGIPEGLDILVTHGPAFGILDDTVNGMRVGCEELYKKIFEVKPKYHICGHIHYARGYRAFDGVTFINAACLGENYQYQNKPIVLILDKDKDIIDIQGI